MDDNDRNEDDPTEEEIRKLCEGIRKGWSGTQIKSRSVYKSDEYTVSIIKIGEIEKDYHYY